MDVNGKVAKYIHTLTNQDNIGGDLNLFESGLISSLDVLDLITFVEEEFKFNISEDDIGVENFGTINCLVAFIEKQAAHV